MKWLPILLLLILLPAPPPEVRWLDERRALLTWQQAEAADLCITRLAHSNTILILCDHFEAGAQSLKLPPFAQNDAELWPETGDVYAVGGRRTAPLGPYVWKLWLPLARR